MYVSSKFSIISANVSFPFYFLNSISSFSFPCRTPYPTNHLTCLIAGNYLFHHNHKISNWALKFNCCHC